MQKQKLLGLAAAAAFVLAPAMARADDAATGAGGTATSAHDQCVNDCMANCDKADTGAGSTATPKKAKKHAMKSDKGIDSTGAGSSAQGGSAKVDVNVNPGVSGQTSQNVDLDKIRADERARAAEEFQAEEQRMNAEHQAELERVRSDAADSASKKSEADIAAARADEDRKLEERRITTETKSPLGIQKAALTPVGVYGQVGGGYSNFTQPTTAAVTNGGGFWDARLGVGSRSILGLEADYDGGAHNITALGLNNSAYLMNNGIEGLVRLNVPVTMQKSILEPYAFGGAGWQHYNLMNVSSNVSDVRNNDDILDVPVGAGLQIGYSGVTLDGRVTYRQAFFSDLLGHSSSSFSANSLNSWGAGATLGFEF